MINQNLDNIGKIRSFNRFYTNLLGLLDRTLLKSPFSLIEVRILFEINRLSTVTASELTNTLNLDPAYLSRILSRLEEKKLVRKERSSKDMRKQLLSLTPSGQIVISELQEKANEQIRVLLFTVTEEDKKQLVSSMRNIERILKYETENSEFYTIRSHKSGDIGYIIYRHGVIYANEYQLDESFEAYVAKYLALFIENYNQETDHLWIVENDSKIVGSIAIVKGEGMVAQLRWFLVEPPERNKGIGNKLMQEAINFCQNRGYMKVTLGTIKDLKKAR
ncbi:hypothetical protein LCGC14_2177250, partial [marine sediment metagenome]